MSKLILVTNDDGIHAEGLRALERSMRVLAEVVVVAPDREMSAASQGLSVHTPLRAHKLDETHYGIFGTPADSVVLALHKLLATRPNLVVSGINPGGNLGENIFYSGTVAAAMEATIHGIPAIAFSLASRKYLDFSTAAAFATQISAKVLDEGLPPGVMLNVNVPRGEVRGVRVTRQSRKISQNVIHEQKDPRGRPYYWHDETVDFDSVEPDSDYAADPLARNLYHAVASGSHRPRCDGTPRDLDIIFPAHHRQMNLRLVPGSRAPSKPDCRNRSAPSSGQCPRRFGNRLESEQLHGVASFD